MLQERVVSGQLWSVTMCHRQTLLKKTLWIIHCDVQTQKKIYFLFFPAPSLSFQILFYISYCNIIKKNTAFKHGYLIVNNLYIFFFCMIFLQILPYRHILLTFLRAVLSYSTSAPMMTTLMNCSDKYILEVETVVF